MGGMWITNDDISRFNMNKFVWYLDIAVVLILEEIYHWTVSCGFSIVETVYYFISGAECQLVNLESSYACYVDSAGFGGNDGLIEIFSLYFKVCRELEVP